VSDGVERYPGTGAAVVAAVLGVVFAGVSAYWALGGTWLLDTVGGALEARGRSGDAAIVALVWASVVLKLVAAGLGVATVRRWFGGLLGRLVRIAAWVAAVVLVGYGAALTVGGLLVLSGVINPTADADLRAIRWHALFWDPWFLIWGVFLLVALLQSRRTLQAVVR
jgi:Protein of unknown function (DUF3995)